MSADKRKPFKETVVGKFLKDKLPDVVDKIGDVFPAANLLKLVVGEKLSTEDKIRFDELMLKYEELSFQDRKDARNRESEFLKALGHIDWMMYFVCIVGLAAFTFILYVLVYVTLPESNRDLFIHAIGMVEGVAVSIFTYYFGSSKGSADKTKLLK